MTKYRVLKECVIERAHFDVGQKYRPAKITREELDKLIEYGFLEMIKDWPWKPEEGETDYYITADGKEGACVYMAEYELPYALRRNEIGNSFPTREQRDKAREWLKAFKVLREDTKGFKPDWGCPDQDKFMVFYDHTDKYLDIIEHCDTQAELIIFATEADAEKSIKNHKKEWLTFFGIEDDGIDKH